MVGKNVKLYDMVLQFLRTLFLRTRNVHYCTLRAELLMSLHDLDVGDICSVDPCHKVAPLSSGLFLRSFLPPPSPGGSIVPSSGLRLLTRLTPKCTAAPAPLLPGWWGGRGVHAIQGHVCSTPHCRTTREGPFLLS